MLVTGATGFTGSHLVRRLCEEGAEVRAIVRASSDRSGLAGLPVRWFEGDVGDEALVRAAMEGVEVVFHIATLYRYGQATEAEHYRVHVESTQHLARAAAEQGGFRRFVQVSTVGVHGHIEEPPANEESPFRPGDEYQRTKAEAERWLREFAKERGLSYTIVRPCGIYGPGDRRLLKVFKMAARRVSPILGRRPCLYHLIHVEDLVGILLAAAVKAEAEGEAFIAGDAEPIPLDRMLRVIGEALGRKVRIVRLPVGPFMVAATVCEGVCRPLGITPPIYRRRVKFFLNDRSFDTRKLRERLGYACKVKTEEGLAATARAYRAEGWL